MSEDYGFEEFDSAMLDEVEIIEARHLASQPTILPKNPCALEGQPPIYKPLRFTMPIEPRSKLKATPSSRATTTSRAEPVVAAASNADTSFDYGFEDDDFDEDILAQVEQIESQYQKNPKTWKPQPLTRQTTLEGLVLSREQELQAGPSSARKDSSTSGQQPPKTKEWDRTAFAKSGWRKTKKHDRKGKRIADGDEDEDEGEEIEFEQFPAPFVSIGPPPPMRLAVDQEAAKEWIYPISRNHARRDYQFNIVKASLFDNSLVALPTGLGKTFIAGVIMLNYYRWFPQGKVVFVAPTKPLVAQQVEACHQTCGIPGRDAVELTGNIPRGRRATEWVEKRVFYMTPQTLMNDLATENCDPGNIVLLVVDEAHKATGDYAYCQVVRYMMARNPNFRLLALTATPGSTPDAVQSVIDSLHISHIEIRDENAIDIRPYINQKKVEVHVIQLSEEFATVRDRLASIMNKHAQRLSQSGILRVNDVVRLNPYRCQRTLGDLFKSGGRHNYWAATPLKILGALARSMGYLMEQSMGMSYRSISNFITGTEDDDAPKKGGKSKAKKPSHDPDLLNLLKEMEHQKDQSGGYFPPHPKLDKLLEVILDHFQNATGDSEEPSGEPATRAMVFVSFRDCVDEVVETLNQHGPMLKATRFVGQGIDKAGKKGIAQKEQIEVIKRFKRGEFNILVSTSIGEEGLDIGEVDLIICYDSPKTPIRTLQRSGRTGRKRAGYVHVLQTEGREEENYHQSKVSYQEVQKSIHSGMQLELFGDAERLLPPNVHPKCVEKEVTIEEYVREPPGKRKVTKNAHESQPTKKRKTVTAIPSGASTGFVSVKDLIVKGGDKATLNTANSDDEQPSNSPPSKKKRTKTAQSRSPKGPASKNVQPKKRAGLTAASQRLSEENSRLILTAADIDAELQDDSEDAELELGLSGTTMVTQQKRGSRQVSTARRPKATAQSTPKFATKNSSRLVPPNRSVKATNSITSLRTLTTESNKKGKSSSKMNTAWLFSDSDDELGLKQQPASIPFNDNSIIEIDDSSADERRDIYPVVSRTPGPSTKRTFLQKPSPQTDLPLAIDSDDMDVSFDITAPGQRRQNIAKIGMSPEIELSHPIQGPSRRRIRRGLVDNQHSPSGGALGGEFPEPQIRPRKQKALLSRIGNGMFEMEAEQSGDDMSLGGSDGTEDEYEASFVNDGVVTQAPAGYNQRAIYHQTLMTQVPAGAPAFASKPKRPGQFGSGRAGMERQRQIGSSSPQQEANSEDYYELGSFIVEDDDDILLAEGSSDQEV